MAFKKDNPVRTMADAFREAGVTKWSEQAVLLMGMKVDLQYQRELKMHKVQVIKSEFDPIACMPLLVLRKADGLWCIDGNHSRHALMELGFHHWRALVIEGISDARAARAFLKRNTSRAPATASEKFKTQLFLQDQIALEIVRVIKEQGFELVLRSSRGHRSFLQLDCVEAIQDVFRQGGPGGLARTLRIVKNAWEDSNDSHGTRGVILRAIFRFLYGRRWLGIRQDDIVTLAIAKVNPSRLIARTSVDYARPQTALVDEFGRMYNRHARGKAKLQFAPDGEANETHLAKTTH